MWKSYDCDYNSNVTNKIVKNYVVNRIYLKLHSEIEDMFFITTNSISKIYFWGLIKPQERAIRYSLENINF